MGRRGKRRERNKSEEGEGSHQEKVLTAEEKGKSLAIFGRTKWRG